MVRWLPLRFSLLILLLASIYTGCGGGGQGVSNNNGVPGNLVAHKVMTWIPPTSYTDGTPLDPHRDLDFYIIFINQDKTSPAAQVSAVDSNGTLVTSFNLASMGPVFDKGSNSVTMKAVSRTGEISDLSAPAYFTL